MILLELFLGFLEVGCFSFGGAYGAIGLIRDVVLSYGWLSDETIAYMIAVSESTPGPIMINMATYVGSSQAGFLGALVATTAVVLPSFLIILLVTTVLTSALKNCYVKAVLQGLKPCVVGIVLATGIYMIVQNSFGSVLSASCDLRAVVITVLLVLTKLLYQRMAKKKLSPILLIVISAVAGVFVFGI